MTMFAAQWLDELWPILLLLVAFFLLGGTVGGEPPSVRSLSIMTLALWLFVPWGWWVDRHREQVLPAAQRSL
jgi:hypothetical protein